MSDVPEQDPSRPPDVPGTPPAGPPPGPNQPPPGLGQPATGYGQPPQPGSVPPPGYGIPSAGYAPPPGYGQPPTGYAPPPVVPGRTLGIVAFILSFFISLVGLILGIVALVQSKKAGHKNGFALAAIIIGGVEVVLAIVGVIVLVSWLLSLAAAVQACVQDPGAIVTIWGIRFDCASLQYGRY